MLSESEFFIMCNVVSYYSESLQYPFVILTVLCSVNVILVLPKKQQSGQMQKSFEDATFGLEVGQMSEAVDSDSGIHVILRTH